MSLYSLTATVEVLHLQNANLLYVEVPLAKIPPGPKRGWRSVPVMVTVGRTTWRTSIFRLTKGHYFIPLKKAVRDKENIEAGDKVSVSYRPAKKSEI